MGLVILDIVMEISTREGLRMIVVRGMMDTMRGEEQETRLGVSLSMICLFLGRSSSRMIRSTISI